MFFVAAQLVVGQKMVLPDDVVMIGWHLKKVAPLEAEGDWPGDPREATLRIHTTDPAKALGAIAPILDAHTATFEYAMEEGDEPGVTVIRFDMRLLKKVKPKAIAKKIQATGIPEVTRIEGYPAPPDEEKEEMTS